MYSNALPSDLIQAWAIGRISFTEVMILFLLRLAVYLSTVFTSSEREIEEVGLFFNQVSYSIKVFLDNSDMGRTWKLRRRDITGGHKSVDYSGGDVAMRKLMW